MICQRLRDERKRLGWSQPSLGDIAGAAKRTVIDWEKGVSSPTTAQLAELGRNGVDVLYVLTGRRSIAPVDMSEAQVEEFNRLINLYWSASDKTREIIATTLSGLHAQDVQAGTARGVRKPSTPKPTAPAKAKPPRKAG